MRYNIYILLALCCLSGGASAQNFNGGFSFYLPEFDAAAATFLPSFPAYKIEEKHRVSAEGAQFMADGKPVRFWGVNIVAAGAFPPKDKAAGIAARMRKMGINLVRFHHLENNWSGDDGCIFKYSQGTRSLQAATLDRLDYFIAQLKENGIYVNMNLNVSRIFRAQDGVPGADSLADFAKGVTLYDPSLQMLQKEYAQQLLGHVNPYTGLPLAKDPVLAMVEMNNENSLYGFWKEDRLRAYAEGGSLIHRHTVLLDQLWNNFLKEKYPTQNALAAAWNAGQNTAGATDLLKDKGFESGTVISPWELETHNGALAAVSAVADNPYAGAYCARLQVNKIGSADWHIQFKQRSIALKKDSAYVLRFFVRASGNLKFSATVMRDDDPYTWYAGDVFTASGAWQEYELVFTAPENVSNARISFSPLQNIGSFWFDQFSLTPPGGTGLQNNENLNTGTVQRILWSRRLLFSSPRVADMAAFYIGLQKKHFDDLRAYLKNTVGVWAPITGTNALVGLADAAHQEEMDYLDDHSYWDHPWFPDGAWDPSNWLISNQAMVKNSDFGAISAAFSGLAYQDKPFTVSEYNHAAPNRFRVEMPPAMAAYAAFHGADGIMFFDYNGDHIWEPDVLDNFFSLNRDNSVMALFPACAYAFRKGLIAEDPAPIVLRYAPETVYNAKKDPEGRWGRFLPFKKRLGLTHSVRAATYRAAQSSNFNDLPDPGGSPYTTATGETTLDTGKGVLKTATPHFCAVSGFLNDASNTTAGDLTLAQANDFGAVVWTALGDAPLSKSKRSLLTVVSRQQNANMVWDGLQTVHTAWGNAPTWQYPLQTTLRLRINADVLRLYALNNTGKEGAFTIIQPVSAGVFEIKIDQTADKTLWFGIEAFGAGISAAKDEWPAPVLRLSPNPVTQGPLRMAWSLPQPAPLRLDLKDAQGRLLRSVRLEKQAANGDFEWPMDDRSAGVYFVTLTDLDQGKATTLRFVKMRQ